jgi:hypothetical protein
LQGIQNAGGMQAWARQQGLLGRALARQREMGDYRLRAMGGRGIMEGGAAFGSPYAAVGLAGGADYAGF